MSEVKQIACSNCKFCFTSDHLHFNYTECRLNPPQFILSSNEWKFPAVTLSTWCGSHKIKV